MTNQLPSRDNYTSDREWFVDWFDELVTRAIPDNFEDFTEKQLRDYAYGVLFDGLDKENIAPPDKKISSDYSALKESSQATDIMRDVYLFGSKDCKCSIGEKHNEWNINKSCPIHATGKFAKEIAFG